MSGAYGQEKKRVMEDSFADALSNKRAALEGVLTSTANEESDLVFKVLCPTTIAGILIGKSGITINTMNATCGAKIKLSGNNEFYPGSQDRIVILTGNMAGISNAIKEVVTRIAEAPDKKPSTAIPAVPAAPPANRGPTGQIQVKCLVPKGASGNLIGKGGSVVRQMSETSKCRINLADNADPYGTNERIVVINGPAATDVVLGTQTVMTQLLENHLIRTYSNLQSTYPTAPGIIIPAAPSAGAPPVYPMAPVPGMMMPGVPLPGMNYAQSATSGMKVPVGAYGAYPTHTAQTSAGQHQQTQPKAATSQHTAYPNPAAAAAMSYQQQQPVYQYHQPYSG